MKKRVYWHGGDDFENFNLISSLLGKKLTNIPIKSCEITSYGRASNKSGSSIILIRDILSIPLPPVRSSGIYSYVSFGSGALVVLYGEGKDLDILDNLTEEALEKLEDLDIYYQVFSDISVEEVVYNHDQKIIFNSGRFSGLKKITL